MKKLIITALLLVGVATFAQDANAPKNKKEKRSKEMKSPEQRSEALMAKMTTELNLDANQQAQMKTIIAEQGEKMEAVRAQMKANRDSGVMPSDADKKEMRKNRMAEKEATDNKITAILSAEQFVKYQAMQEEVKAKMKERMKPSAE